MLYLILIGVVIALMVWYDARGREWAGWTGPAFWGAMTVVFSLFALPFYLVARARTTKAQPQRTMPAAPSAPAAGWYSDPGGDGRRYWDGSSWTRSVAP